MHIFGSRDHKEICEVESVLFYVHRVVYPIGRGRNTDIVPVPINHLLGKIALANQIAQDWQSGGGLAINHMRVMG